MPIHDWTLVEAGIFHDFHTVWVAEIRNALNAGRLPKDYYALAEQHAGKFVADVLTLQVEEPSKANGAYVAPTSGGVALAEVRPKVRREVAMTSEPETLRRSIAIRHVSGHRLVALIEIVSPGNKDRAEHLEEFVAKAVSALNKGVHLLLVDLFPPTAHDPQGLHGKVAAWLNSDGPPYDLPAAEPLTFACYSARPPEKAYLGFLEHAAVGAAVPDMPIFLTPDRYVMVPLAETYAAAWNGMPEFWRKVLETPLG